MIKTDSSRIIFESIKDIKTSMLVNLDLDNNSIWSCLLSFFLNIDFLISAAIPQIFNPIAELAIPIELLNKEAKAAIEIHSVIVQAKIRKCSI